MYISKILNVSVMFDYVLIKKQEKKSYTWTFNDTIHIFLSFAFYAIYATRSTPRVLRHALYVTRSTLRLLRDKTFTKSTYHSHGEQNITTNQWNETKRWNCNL